MIVLRVEGPLGPWSVTFDGQAVVRCGPGEEGRPLPHPAADALRAWFDGDLHALDDVPVAARGTSFQQAVWAAVRAVPPGQTRTYGQIAAALGRPPGAARAVGAAVGANPCLIFVPCHRVVGATGALTGYAGGLDRKAWLLAHERR